MIKKLAIALLACIALLAALKSVYPVNPELDTTKFMGDKNLAKHIFENKMSPNDDPYNTVTDITDFMSQQSGAKLNFSVITGYFPIDWYFPQSKRSSIFFEMTLKQGEMYGSISKDTPIIFWFQGGPGGPSQFGSFVELGPFVVSSTSSLKLNPNSWNKEAMLVFVDQPLNVGLSYTDTKFMVNNTVTGSKHMQNFFYNFFQYFKDLRKNPIYFFGESYAGHYIPQYAMDFLKNENFTDINFQGVGIGDGLTEGLEQFAYYDTYLYATGLFSLATQKTQQQNQAKVTSQIQAGNYDTATKLQNINEEYIEKMTDNVNMYNYEYEYGQKQAGKQSQDSAPVSFMSFKKMKQTLRNLHESDIFSDYVQWIKKNRDHYGIPKDMPETYFGGNDAMYDAFTADISMSFKPAVDYLVNRTKVLIYNGQLDIIVNTPGAEFYVNSLNWSGLPSWKSATKQLLTLDQDSYTVVGNYKHYDKFTFCVMYGSGHMVPLDQPVASMQMVHNFLFDKFK